MHSILDPVSSGARKERVGLIVEAGQTSLSTRKMVVETAGYNCLSAVSCVQALGLADRHPVDFILFDIDVHDLPPRDTITRLRQKYPAAPVYLLTPQGWEPEPLRGISDGVFEKMRDPTEMIREIERRFPEDGGPNVA